jgi:hypothetical protein
MTGDPVVSRPIGQRLALLRRLGFGELTHDSHVPFLSHLLGTRRLLAKWGERGAMCDAGLFHSAYGTEFFQPDQPASRSEVRQLIGGEAEEIAWVWCTISRDTIGTTPPHTVGDRRTGELLTLSAGMVADIATLWAADTVEQIARMASDEHGFAHGLDRVLQLARPAAIEASASTTRVTS